MATICREELTAATGNNKTVLKECYQAETTEAFCRKYNWLGASLWYSTPGAWALTPKYFSVLAPSKEKNILALLLMQMILFKPPTWETSGVIYPNPIPTACAVELARRTSTFALCHSSKSWMPVQVQDSTRTTSTPANVKRKYRRC